MRGDGELPVIELGNAQSRLLAATELGRRSVDEHQEAITSFEQERDEFIEQIKDHPGLAKTEKLAWMVAVSRLDENPAIVEEAERYLAKIRLVNKTLKVVGTPILIWGKYRGGIREEANTFASNGKGLKIYPDGFPDSRVRIAVAQEHPSFSNHPEVEVSSITEAILSTEDLEARDSLLEDDEHGTDNAALLVIGDEAIVAFVERMYKELDEEYAAQKEDGHQGNDHVKYKIFKSVESAGLDICAHSDIVREFVDEKRKTRIEEEAGRLVFGYMGRHDLNLDLPALKERARDWDVPPVQVLEAALEMLESSYQGKKGELLKLYGPLELSRRLSQDDTTTS